MPDFELRFVAVPEIKQDADKDLRKQWEQKFQRLVVGRVEVNAEIPKQTLTKLRNQYTSLMNDLGRTSLDVSKDISALGEQYGKAFDMTGIANKFQQDMGKVGQTTESLIEQHRVAVQGLESEYVNLKAKMREASQTLTGEAKSAAIDELERQVKSLGDEIKQVFSADELQHFTRTMGELGNKGATQVVGIQEFADSISGLRTRIVELAGEGERLVRVTQEWDGKQWVDTSTQIQDRTQRLRDEFKKFEKQVRDLENRYQLSQAGSSYAQEWKNMTYEMESFNAEMPDARQNLERWQEVLSRTKGELGNAGNNLSKYKEQLKDVRDAEVALKLAQLESHGLRTTAVIQAEAVVEEKRQEAEETKRLLVNTDKLNDANVAYTKSEEALKQSLDKTEKAWKKKNSLLSNISAGFADATARIINYTSVYRAMWFAVSKFKQSIQTAEELNKAFTSIQLVTLGTAEATEKLRNEYADLAVEMSATVTDVAEGADAWLRQGKSAEEATQLIRASMVMSRIGVIESAEATEYLTSVLNGYKMETQDVMHVVDAMSQVDIESASSIDDLAIALQRSTATAQQAGVSFERLLGYVAAVRETTQRSASVIGEAMKSIFSRMGSVKAGTFLSEDLESEYTDITTYVNDVEKVLSKVGIRLRDTNKDFRDAQDVLDDVAKGWETYDDLTKQSLATAIAGTRQRENFLALMSSYDKALELENSALNSNGKAMQKYAVYQDSIAAKQDRINALAQTWVQNMNFEWAIGQLLNLGEAFMKVFSNELVVQAGMATAAILAFIKAGRSLVLMGKLFMEMRGLVTTGKLLTQILGAAGLGTILPVVAALTIAITGLVYIIEKLHHSAAELSQELQSLGNEIDTSQGEIDEYKSKIAENDEKIQELQDTINKGVGGLVEQDELDRLKEENKQLERQIALEEKRLELIKEQRKQTADELHGKTFSVGQYRIGRSNRSSRSERTVVEGTSISVAPEEVIDAYQKQIDNLRKEYEKAADDGNEKLASTIEAKINELESELTNTVVPQLELLREYYPEIAAVLDAYYDSLMSYSDKVEDIKDEYSDAYSELGKIVAENADVFKQYLEDGGEDLDTFIETVLNGVSPAIREMVQAAQEAGIPFMELVRILLNAARAGEDFSDSINLETPASQITKFKDKVKSVVAAEEELAESGYVSADAAADLAEAYGDDVYDAMVWTSKGYKISRSELEALIEKEKESYVLALNEAKQAAASIITANAGKATSWNMETSAILENINALKQQMLMEHYTGRGARGLPEGWDEIGQAAKDLETAQENYDNLLKTLAYLRTSSSSSKKSDAETAYEREIRLLEHELYLSQQLADLYDGENDEANYRAEVNKQMAIYIKLMEAAHAEAERLRKLGYAETSQEIQDLQQAWWGYYNAKRDLASGLADWEKQTTEDALNDVKDAINDLLDEAEDRLNDKLDALQAKIDKNEAIKKLHEVFFGILNDVADGIHEIDKELEVSLSTADYLDEQLRQAMFNEDDYNKMSAKLNQIADESRVLFKDYLNQLEMLTEDEMYKADYITDEFERQYQYKELEYNIAEKELALAKAQTKLQNTLMNRNVRMYKNGQWIWTADYSAVQEAKKEVRDAEYEYRDAEIKLKQQEVLDKYAGIISALNLQKDAAQNEFDRLKDYWERVQKQLTTEESAMQRLLNAINNTDIPQFRQIINSVGKGLIDLINGIGTGTGMGSLIGTDEKYYGESASGELYPIGTDKGKDFIENAPAGSTMTGGDGSQWTKLADGSTMITKKGKVYYVPAPSYGGGSFSFGGGSNINYGTGSIYNPAGGTTAGGWSFGAGGTMVSGSGYVAGSSGGKNTIGTISNAASGSGLVPAYSGGQPHYSGGYGDDYVAPRTDGWTPGETLPGTSGTSPAGTAYDQWVLADGSPPNLTYKDTGVYSPGTSPSIKGADMRRDSKWAGQTVEKNGYVISYDEDGYARSAINVRAGSRNENLANKYPRVDADGNIMYSKSGMWSSNTGRGYYYSTSDTVDDTIYWDESNPNYVGGTPSSDLNQRRYLENLVKSGTYGQREWAKAELAKMGTSTGSSSSGGSSGGGSSSSGGSSSKGSSSSSSSSSDSGKSNQQRYLESLVESGSYGQKEWAKDQLNKGLYDSGGILEGMGGIKATAKDETVFGPELSSKLLSPQKSKEFLNSATALTKILDNSGALNAMLNRFAGIVGGNNSVANDSHDVYFNGNPLGGMTRADSVALTSILRRYIPISGGGR